ncbi:MAG: hypothetical protein GY940_07705, partial [bacterium]|nr:hypothetical protein [bacterium]
IYMKKNIVILFSLILVSTVCIGLLVANISDPSGTLEQVLNLEASYRAQAQEVIADAPMDFHPKYGKLGIKDFPMNPDGWDDSQVESLFPGEIVLNYSVTPGFITGRAFVQHRATDGTVFGAWHDLVNEPIVTVTATVSDLDGGQPRGKIVRIIKRCSNGMILVEDEHGNQFWVDPSALL